MNEYEEKVIKCLDPHLHKDLSNIICNYLQQVFTIKYDTRLPRIIQVKFVVIKSIKIDVKDNVVRKLLLKVVDILTTAVFDDDKIDNDSYYKINSLHIAYMASMPNGNEKFIPLFANIPNLSMATNEQFHTDNYLCVYSNNYYSYPSRSSSYKDPSNSDGDKLKQFLESKEHGSDILAYYYGFKSCSSSSMFEFLSSLAF
jgi:hypothetical protein